MFWIFSIYSIEFKWEPDVELTWAFCCCRLNATCAAYLYLNKKWASDIDTQTFSFITITFWRSTTNKQLGHLQSFHLHIFLCDFRFEIIPWFLHLAHFGVRFDNRSPLLNVFPLSGFFTSWSTWNLWSGKLNFKSMFENSIFIFWFSTTWFKITNKIFVNQNVPLDKKRNIFIDPLIWTL